VVALQTPHIGLQLLDASLDVQLSVLKPRLLQQRLLVFQVPTLPIPPVTNKKKISNLKNPKRKTKKLQHIYQKKKYYRKLSPTTDIRPPKELTAD